MSVQGQHRSAHAESRSRLSTMPVRRILAALALVASGVVVIAWPSSAFAESHANSAAPGSVDFGSVPENTTAHAKVTLSLGDGYQVFGFVGHTLSGPGDYNNVDFG